MANSPQARKRVRQAERARVHNRGIKNALRTEVKRLQKMLASDETKDLDAQVRIVESKADKAAKRNVIHAKTADRIKRRVKVLVSGK